MEESTKTSTEQITHQKGDTVLLLQEGDFIKGVWAFSKTPIWGRIRRFNNGEVGVRDLHKIILNKATLQEALAIVNEVIIESEGYRSLFDNLKPLDRLVLVAINKNNKELFSEATAKEFSEILNKGVKVTTIQYTVNKLSKLQLITKFGRSEYAIERPGFGQFIIENSL